MFVPLSDDLSCNRFSGTASFERMEDFIDSALDSLIMNRHVSNWDIEELYNKVFAGA